MTEPGENQSQVEGDKRQGTKAMVLKSVALDDKNTVVMAIRGSQTFRDWAINFQEVPVSPVGFLVSLLPCMMSLGQRECLISPG